MRGVVEHYARTGEIDFTKVDPEVEFDNRNATFESGFFTGHDGVLEGLRRFGEMWETQRFEPIEFIPAGADQVVVVVRTTSVGREGIETVAHNGNLYTLRGGSIVRVKTFQTKEEALEAVGISE